MTKVQLTAVAGALVLALSLSAGASRLEAQDTSTVRPTPADTSGYSGGAGVDTTAQPGVTDTTGGAMDTTGWHKPAGDTTAPDTTRPGDSTETTPQGYEAPMHPDSAGVSDSSGQAAAPGATSSPSNSSSPPSESSR
jgi:hypothetical protein